jgi:hypothetical protein
MRAHVVYSYCNVHKRVEKGRCIFLTNKPHVHHTGRDCFLYPMCWWVMAPAGT